MTLSISIPSDTCLYTRETDVLDKLSLRRLLLLRLPLGLTLLHLGSGSHSPGDGPEDDGRNDASDGEARGGLEADLVVGRLFRWVNEDWKGGTKARSARDAEEERGGSGWGSLLAHESTIKTSVTETPMMMARSSGEGV